MNRNSLLVRLCVISLAMISVAKAESVESTMRRVFDWQMNNLWSTQQSMEHRWSPRGWVHGAFLTGVMEAYRATGDTAYLEYAQQRAEANDWRLGTQEVGPPQSVAGLQRRQSGRHFPVKLQIVLPRWMIGR